MKTILFFLFLLINAVIFSQKEVENSLPDYPIANKIPYYFVTHGDSVLENYYWMKTKHTPEIVNYLYAENAYADYTMKSSAILQKKLFEEMRLLMKDNDESRPFRVDNYYYYAKFLEGNEQAIYCRKKDSLTALEEIYFNPNIPSDEFGVMQISNLQRSQDHSLIAYSVVHNGSSYGTLCVKNIAQDSIYPDRISNVQGFLLLPDNKSLFYMKRTSKTKMPNQLYLHTMGTDTLSDRVIFESKDPRASFGFTLSHSKRFLFISLSYMDHTGDMYVIDLNTTDIEPKKIYNGEKGVHMSLSHYEGETFIMLTNKNASGFVCKEVAINDFNNEKIVFPEEKGVELNSVELKGDFLIVGRQNNAENEVIIVNRKTNQRNKIIGPELNGVLSFSNLLKYDSTAIEYSFSSLKSPTSIFRYDLINNTSEKIWQDTLPNFKTDLYITERIWANARDGKKIPIDLVYKKGIKRDGKNPLYITGYACYGNNIDPTFNAEYLPYLERNFICAIAHPRGESILGKQWHDDGKMLKKKNTIYDFVDCTQSLIDSNYTCPKKIIAEGRSAGGLLMGGIANERPEIYGAILAGVPFVNTLEDMMDTLVPNIPYHFTEIGNPYIKKEYDYIKSYSPLHNIEAKAYPNMLVTAGYNDENVPYWAPVQYVAKLRDMKTDTNMLLLKTAMDAGHFGSSGRYSGLKETAFNIAFCLKALGIDEEYLTVTGKLVDETGESIPYSNVYIEGTTNGTMTNYDGEFNIVLKQGQKFSIVFQAFGYKKQTYQIGDKTKINDIRIVMQSESRVLEEVAIVANTKTKNRGYEIIRKANEQKDHYDKLLDNYSVNVYVKGIERMDSVPKKLPAFMKSIQLPDSNDLGLTYLSESVAGYNFQKPDNYKEEMLSSRVAGRKQGLSGNRVSEVNYNFYQNTVMVVGEKPFISPIADGGIVLYKYDYDSKFLEDNQYIHKIKVTPRNKAEAVFGGYIYIRDNTWDIHSVDLYITKASGVEFLDSLYIKQINGMIGDSISAPRSVNVNIRYKIFGFSGGFVNVGSFYNYQFNKKFPKKFFQKQVFSIATDAIKKDSIYWQENRPIILTNEELKYNTKADTIVKNIYYSGDTIPDSIQKLFNKVTVQKLVFMGYRYKKNGHSFHLRGLVNDLGYNTIEGIKTELNVSYVYHKAKKEEEIKSIPLRFSSKTRYGFSSKKYYSKLTVGKSNYAEQRVWDISAGNWIHQFNGNEPIIDVVNAGYSLIMRQNFTKLYEKRCLNFQYSDVLKSGPKIQFKAEYGQRIALQNHENWFISDKIKDQTTSNNPLNPLSDSLSFQKHNALILNFNGSYTFGEKFEMIYNFRRVLHSRYPTIYWEFEQGIKALGSTANFGRYQIGIGKSIHIGYWGKSNIDVIAGGFTHKAGAYFMDYKHFNGNETHILKNGQEAWLGRSQLDQFNALSYYGFSTIDHYIEFHYQHRFLGLFLTKIPLLNKLHLQEVVGINAVYTSGNRNYQELYVGVENIAKIIRIDFVVNYKVGDVIQPLIRIGVKKAI